MVVHMLALLLIKVVGKGARCLGVGARCRVGLCGWL